MRTLNKIFKLDKEKFKIPRCVQDIIPIKAIWEDGIFQVSKNKFSKSNLFILLLFIVILVIAPTSNEFNKSE